MLYRLRVLKNGHFVESKPHKLANSRRIFSHFRLQWYIAKARVFANSTDGKQSVNLNLPFVV